MNQCKEGRKFVYPYSFIKLLVHENILSFTRQTEGVVREYASNTLPSIPDYNNISRRINKLDIKICNYKFNIIRNKYRNRLKGYDMMSDIVSGLINYVIT